jgi:alpha-ribazole phosphatase
MKLVILRHSALPNAWKGRFLGQMDPRSIPVEDAHLNKINEKLKALNISSIYSSDLIRCSELAEILQDRFFSSLSIKTDSRLREVSFGDWEGKLHEELSESELTKSDYTRFLREFPNFPPPNAETVPEFLARIRNFLNTIFTTEDRTVLIVSHAGVIRGIASIFLNLDFSQTFGMQLDYLSISRFQWEKDFTNLTSWNEIV